MKIIPINEAEAIIEPFWDGGTSDYLDCDVRYKVIDEYKISELNHARVKVEQGWAYVTVTADTTVKAKPILSLNRSCEIDISEYDTFIVFASFPTCFRFDIAAIIDGKPMLLCQGMEGKGISEEYNAPIKGSCLTELELVLYSEQSGVQGTLLWFGLANSLRLQQMLKRKNHYNSVWEGYFVQKPPENPNPEIGLLFDSGELEKLRQKLNQSPFQEAYQAKKEKAMQDMQIVPEQYIGRYVPTFDQRWNRIRDKKWADLLDTGKNNCGMHTVIENLAFVGLVQKDLEMMRMAVRHAISIAHCEYWSESVIGNLPGATWHHRSFSESCYCKALALVLDWCGALMTPFAKQVLRDAIVMKGLPRIESDFKRAEYIRYMNQGIVFSYGRIFGLLALLPRYPRYLGNLREAEQDLLSIVANYVQEDGGTLEGPGYWIFTFNEVLPAFYALARQKQVDFSYYKNVFEKTGDFALSMLSMEGKGVEILPVNDAHPKTRIPCGLASCFYQFTQKEEWRYLYEALMEQGRIDKDTFALICSPLPDGKSAAVEQRFGGAFPITGQCSVMQQGTDLKSRIHLCSGPTYPAHFHGDKGSIILEAEGKTLCPDPGSANYYESELFYLAAAQSHSLLNPIFESGACANQGRMEQGGTIRKATTEGIIEFVSEDTKAWSENAYRFVQRRILSPCAELYLIEDTFELNRADYVQWQLNCFGQFKAEKEQAVAQVGDITVRVVPLNWSWEQVAVKQFQDGEHRPIWQLQGMAKSKKQQIVTAICLEKNQQVLLSSQLPNQWDIRHGSQAWKLYKDNIVNEYVLRGQKNE